MKQSKTKRSARWILAVMLVAVLSLSLATPALAGEYITDNYNAVVEEDEVIDDDLFISAQFVEVYGTIKGDLFATGEYVLIRGKVEGNLFASGAIIVLGGEVEGGTFVGGYALQIEPEAELSRNLYFGGYSMEALEGSEVGRSLYGGGYQFQLNGEIGRDATIGGGAIRLNGEVGGDMLVDVAEPRYTDDMVVVPTMFWQPSMDYDFSIPVVPEGLDVEDGEIGGELEHRVTYYDAGPHVTVDVPEVPVETLVLNRLRKRAGELVGLLLVGCLMLYLGFGWTEKVVNQTRDKVWASLGWGALVFLLYIPVLSVLIFLLALAVLLLSVLTLGSLTGVSISLAGLGFTSLTVAFSIVASLVAKVAVSYLAGHKVIEWLFPDALEGKWGRFWALLTGVVIYEMLRFIPFFGEVFAVLVIVLGVGAVFALLWAKYQSMRPAPVAVE